MFDIFKIFIFLKKQFRKYDLIILTVILALYFITRLVNLSNFPIFTDEGIYINWAKTAWHDASMRFISLTDGKQPLQTWLTIPFLKIFPNQPLFAGRLFGVLSGFISLAGIFVLLTFLFNKKIGFIGTFLYIFNPYFLFYDRMALADSMVNASFIWILFFSILLFKKVRLDLSLIFGLIAGLFLLTKSSTQLFLFLGLLAPITNINNFKSNDFFKKIINFYILYCLVFFLAYLIYNIQRLSPYMHYIGIKNTTFLMTKEEFLTKPFSLFWNNFKGVWINIIWESGFVIPIISIFGFLKLLKKDRFLGLYLFFWFIIPFLIICSISKVIFPRYLIFFSSVFIILTSYIFYQSKNKNIYFLLGLIFAVNLYFNYKILFDFKNISFPPIDRGQYIEGPPAGWGVKEIIDYSIEKSREKPVLILAEGNFGLIGDMLKASLPRDNHQVSIEGFWPLEEKHLYQGQEKLDQYYVFAVFPHRTVFPQQWPIKLIKKFEKPKLQSAIYFFEIIK